MAASPSPVSPPVGAAPSEVLDFIASLVGSLAWPAVVLILLLVFRRQVNGLVASIKNRMPDVERFKTPWAELTWSSSAVEQVSNEVDASLPQREESGRPARYPSHSGVARELAHIVPSAGVVHAFLEVEQKVGSYLRAADETWRGTPIQGFRQSAAVSPRLKRLVADLARLRNAAAHGAGDVSLDSAMEYIDSAERVAEELGALTDDLLTRDLPSES